MWWRKETINWLDLRDKMHELFEMACSDTDLGRGNVTRAANCVLRFGCKSADDVSKLDLKEFLRCTKNAGPKTVEVVKRVQEYLSIENNAGAGI